MSQKCCFCDCNETIKHLFFNCQHAKDIWRVVQIATGLTPPRSIRHILGNWLTGIAKKDKKMIFVGVAALLWAIWCLRKNISSRVCMSFLGEHIDCDFGLCCNTRTQGRSSVRQAKH
jgi:hypothetical protein